MNGQLHAPALLPQDTEPPVLTGQKARWAQSPSGSCGGEKNPLPLPGIEPNFLDRRARSWSLYGLNYPW
jgi:hypothetical protein